MRSRVNRRDFLKAIGWCSVGTGVLPGCRTRARSDRIGGGDFTLNECNELRLPFPGLKDSVRFWVVSDVHFPFHDVRDDEHAGNYARMAASGGSKAAFEKFLSAAKSAEIDLLLLTGDILSFPTLANVDYLHSALRSSGLDWMYVAGNHDWHFEGDDGSDLEQRDRWTERRLRPLFPSEANPVAYSRVVRGVRFVAIDDSAYRITPEQLEFWNAEAAKGDPVVLMMHVPIWAEGCGVFTLGNPIWGAATDPYWQIERRQKWDAAPSETTKAFRKSVLESTNLVACFSGHLHRQMAIRANGQNLFTVPTFMGRGEYFDVRLLRVEERSGQAK